MRDYLESQETFMNFMRLGQAWEQADNSARGEKQGMVEKYEKLAASHETSKNVVCYTGMPFGAFIIFTAVSWSGIRGGKGAGQCGIEETGDGVLERKYFGDMEYEKVKKLDKKEHY